MSNVIRGTSEIPFIHWIWRLLLTFIVDVKSHTFWRNPFVDEILIFILFTFLSYVYIFKWIGEENIWFWLTSNSCNSRACLNQTRKTVTSHLQSQNLLLNKRNSVRSIKLVARSGTAVTEGQNKRLQSDGWIEKISFCLHFYWAFRFDLYWHGCKNIL